MPVAQKLSQLINEIDATIHNRFAGKTFWIKAEITDVKKYADKRWCFLKFIEKDGNVITTEIKGVFWSNTYYQVENFEKETQQLFASGLEITCSVRVRFHKRFGLDLEVLAIDYAYAIGKMEIERKQTLERLVKENAGIQLLSDGNFSTDNNRLDLPTVFQKIALVTAPNSDGQRDFKEVIEKNKYGYSFYVKEFLTQVQGDAAATLIMQQLENIKLAKAVFDVVVIVRGGGSDTDFKSFNTFDLANFVASFPIPVLTGIGHDRNTSIVDLMARQHKTPTEVATFIIDNNMSFEQDLLQLKERFFTGVKSLLDTAQNKLTYISRIIKSSSPKTILNKGFAIILRNNAIITDPQQIGVNDEVQAILKDEVLHTTVYKKETNETYNDF
ncbi:MAG: exodeoxyribonuclease VII large subunit [Ferruginibacter sp.]|nr:exodeoxyribonuclease VII large subunit [Ferruginibacter sp.]